MHYSYSYVVFALRLGGNEVNFCYRAEPTAMFVLDAGSSKRFKPSYFSK